MRKLYEALIQVEPDNTHVRRLNDKDSEETQSERQRCVTQHPVMTLNRCEKIKRGCNSASKHKSVAQNDILIADLYLLQNPVGSLTRFREPERERDDAMTAVIGTIFLQDRVPPAGCKFLIFLEK